MTAATAAFTSAGTTLHVCATLPTTYDSTGYAALTWVEVGEIVDMGEFGKKYNVVKHNPLKTRKTVKRKGSFDNGNLPLKLARVPGDAGHVILNAALDSDDSIAFKVTLQDGTKQYSTAQVTSYTTAVGSVDQITGANCDLEIDNDIVEVAPA